ncbi:MAG: Membrane-flanked domain protein [Candidatus Wolfebacteria bacterium GW2011_GWC2_46_275]|uniref:Membrane-flanked domain protein n=2 Tax=Candidatus Wolfeibacteriota TaxID=1752735 RepID=A0A0G1U8R4_9BACT|nr:MAG: membrane-flanked domain-containing protein [Candidatus Wolfebacteria bacterium GW2011_GWB1_47_1]KKU37175.1 MAG: Membrane-flanked domain protein [Candidatus Wolfebacteria bacterium GW2011_GWC2_46_275]KKU42665.1 MAG: Membrane-flanked domain protein [Candidatus Wolfebacteria bacterium GW2011_GWB2_46_69]KKU54600.1 MAG: Membrane-flanked domain protein [Candidatus Wolfebacteria bacterium GW2011_GWC1_47_103]KKU59984.1 MAG: Membrane-flanked domain protein [Candidatus Wolfebacteria bacterium GW2
MAEETTNQVSVSAEQVVATMHAHPLAYLVYYLGGVFIFIVSYWYGYLYTAVGLLVLLVSEVLRRADTFSILEDGVSRNFSLFSTKRVFTGYDKIQTVTVIQSALDRILGVGTVVLITAGLEEGTIQFAGVMKPYEIAKMIQDRLSA